MQPGVAPWRMPLWMTSAFVIALGETRVRSDPPAV
jgi:hypothetical protein